MKRCPSCQRDLPESRFNERWPDCFRCRVRTQRLQPSAAPTSADPRLFRDLAEEKTLGKDGEAYKRLRADGYQPKHINGSAHLEQHAETRFEIESGRTYQDQPAMRAALTYFEDTYGHDATIPATTPITPPDAA